MLWAEAGHSPRAKWAFVALPSLHRYRPHKVHQVQIVPRSLTQRSEDWNHSQRIQQWIFLRFPPLFFADVFQSALVLPFQQLKNPPKTIRSLEAGQTE